MRGLWFAACLGLFAGSGCEEGARVVGVECGETLYCHGHVDKKDGTWDCLFVEKTVLCRDVVEREKP